MFCKIFLNHVLFLIFITSSLFKNQVSAQLNRNQSTNTPFPLPSGSPRTNLNNSFPINDNNNNTNSTLSQVDRANQTQSNLTSTNLSNSTSTNSTSNNNSTSNVTKHSNSQLNQAEVVPLDTKITVQFSILGVLLMASGAPMAFWGGRNRWSSYFLIGAYVVALIVMIPILKFGVIQQDHQPSNVIQGIFVLACLISALAGGAVAVIFWKGTRFVVGAAGGFVISLFILSLKSNSLLSSIGLRWVVMLIGITIGFILATIPVLSIHVTLFATAAMGSAAFVLGIDCFTTGGLKEFWLYIVGFGAMFPKLKFFPFTVTMQAELGLMAGLFLMGAAIQWRLLEIIRKKITELKQLDAERKLEEDAAAYRQSMALDADLALWEKRHGDDCDSVTMTVDPSITKHNHSRKSSQFSLLPLVSPSSSNNFLTKFEDNPVSNDRLPSIDSGAGLAGSLGIVEEISDLEVQNVESNNQTNRTRQFSNHRMSHQNQSQPNTTSNILSINFEQSDNDRRFSRPPGAPSSWSRPLSVSKFNNPPQMSNSRLTPSSPKPSLENVSPLHLRTPDSKPKLDTRRHSETPSRVLVGSYQPTSIRPGPSQKRESTIMTVEELEQRHRLAMKKIQFPATEKVSSSSTDPRQSKEHHPRRSVNLNHHFPNNRHSVRDNATRHSSYLSSERNLPQPQQANNHPDRSPTSPLIHQSPNSNNQKPKSTSNGWLKY